MYNLCSDSHAHIEKFEIEKKRRKTQEVMPSLYIWIRIVE